MLKVLSNILCDLDPKVKVIGQKAGICDGVPSTSALVNFYKCSLSIHATHIFSSNNVSALIIFPQAFKNLFEVLVLLKC